MALFPKTRLGRIRALVLVLLLAGLLVYVYGLPALRYWGYEPEEGDIVFQSLPRVSDLVAAIEGITESPYSHCGVVVKEDGKWIVVESIIRVGKEPLFNWIRRGRWGSFAVYRLKERHRSGIPAFTQALHPFLGRPYDYKYRMDDDALYCSELVWKAYKDATGEELGRLVRLGDMNWKPYEKTIVKYEEGPPPLDRLMITPRHLSEAPQLEKVFGGL
jgi:hypothetical protein